MHFLLTSILIILTIGLSFWNFFPRAKSGPAALQVFSKPEGIKVFLNDQLVGVTPYKSQSLKAGEAKLAIGTGSASFSKIVKLSPKVFTIVNRELSDNPFLQAGESLNLEPGQGLVVLSTPEAAEVEVDDKRVGTTPVKIEDIKAGTHKIIVSKKDFVSRSLQVQVHPNYRLIAEMTLASTGESLAKLLGSIPQPLTILPKIRILPTPTGFLRVRDNPSFSAAEIARVTPGEELSLLEEKTAWFKIRLPDGREGWISAQYAQKL